MQAHGCGNGIERAQRESSRRTVDTSEVSTDGTSSRPQTQQNVSALAVSMPWRPVAQARGGLTFRVPSGSCELRRFADSLGSYPRSSQLRFFVERKWANTEPKLQQYGTL